MTGNLTYLFLIFMVTTVAKHCGNFDNEGLYDIHIDLMGVPMMEEKSPIKNNFVTAKHMMSRFVSFSVWLINNLNSDFRVKKLIR